MVCPKCNREVNEMNSSCPFCNEPLKDSDSTDFYNSFEVKDSLNQQSTGTKAYVPKKATEGLGMKIFVGVLIAVVGFFLIMYLSTEHLFCNGFNGGKYVVFYTEDKVLLCFQSGQGPGDCKATKSLTKEDLEQLGYNSIGNYMKAVKKQIEESKIGNCQ